MGRPVYSFPPWAESGYLVRPIRSDRILATLTGAIIIALGHHHAGLFSNNDELAQRLTEVELLSADSLEEAVGAIGEHWPAELVGEREAHPVRRRESVRAAACDGRDNAESRLRRPAQR